MAELVRIRTDQETATFCIQPPVPDTKRPVQYSR
jgi:hypothetical protein